MAVREILLLGNPRLYDISEPIQENDLEYLPPVVADLHDTLLEFRRKYSAGRAIAACQIGYRRRLIYMFIDKPIVFINPARENKSEDMMEVWDDCMCFPELLVKVRRHKSCTICFRDMEFNEQTVHLDGDLSELLQHEYDHLDGILAVSRAIDERALAFRSQRDYLK